MDTQELQQEIVNAEKFINNWQSRTETPTVRRKHTVEERNALRERYMNLPTEEKEAHTVAAKEGRLVRAKEKHQIQKATDVLEILLQKTLSGGDEADLTALQSLADVAGANITALTAILLKQMQKAINKGDTRAAEFVMRASGNFVEKQEIAVKPVNPLANVSTDDLKMMLAATEEQQESQPPF